MRTTEVTRPLFVLFVGGLQHGKAEYVAADLNALELDDPLLKAGRQRYAKHQWQHVDAAHGFDALFINSFVLPSEYEAKIRDALDVAGRAGEVKTP